MSINEKEMKKVIRSAVKSAGNPGSQEKFAEKIMHWLQDKGGAWMEERNYSPTVRQNDISKALSDGPSAKIAEYLGYRIKKVKMYEKI